MPRSWIDRCQCFGVTCCVHDHVLRLSTLTTDSGFNWSCDSLCEYRNKISVFVRVFFFVWLDSPIWAWASSFRRGFTITHIRHTTFGRTPLDEGPARRRDLYLTSHNTHNRQTSMPPVGFFFCPGFFPFDPFLYY
jgi:hypothetical protein